MAKLMSRPWVDGSGNLIERSNYDLKRWQNSWRISWATSRLGVSGILAWSCTENGCVWVNSDCACAVLASPTANIEVILIVSTLRCSIGYMLYAPLSSKRLLLQYSEIDSSCVAWHWNGIINACVQRSHGYYIDWLFVWRLCSCSTPRAASATASRSLLCIGLLWQPEALKAKFHLAS